MLLSRDVQRSFILSNVMRQNALLDELVVAALSDARPELQKVLAASLLD